MALSGQWCPGVESCLIPCYSYYYSPPATQLDTLGTTSVYVWSPGPVVS